MGALLLLAADAAGQLNPATASAASQEDCVAYGAVELDPVAPSNDSQQQHDSPCAATAGTNATPAASKQDSPSAPGIARGDAASTPA